MDYDLLFKKQRGICPICKEKWTPLTMAGKKRRRMHRDHHRTLMYPRGLLCGKCNRHLKDGYDSTWYASAARYLRRYEKENESG